MRLLDATLGCEFVPSKELEEDDIPRYAILSHTWGADEEEVTYKDLVAGTGKSKSGFRKLEFCADRARQDGVDYFWVDTCCIDKTNNVELNTAITSMFRWYQRAAKCYVYLSDVPNAQPVTEDSYKGTERVSSFRGCRWLRQGWTLQEMLAPQEVEFYDKTGTKLGDKTTLERHICDITGIPSQVLRGHPHSSFSMDERFSWQRSRKTKKPEDLAYSLAGVCEVSMIPNYGEGGDKAMARLWKEIDEVLKGREKELNEIHASLGSDGSRRTVVLHGLGGIGKTQTAVAYAKRHRSGYSATFWFNIRDDTSVKQSFAKAAKRILQHHPSAYQLSRIDTNGDLDDVVEAVNAWLSEADNTRWLAIYDNYDNPKIRANKDAAAVDISRFLPDASQGSVIITTRSSQVRIGQCIPTQKLTDVVENVEILSSMSRRDLSTEDESVLALVRRLDGLPLAIATAGAYLDQVTITVADYLRLYETSWRELHKSDPGLDSYEDRTLYSTWRVSLDQIQQQNELSAKLLGLWCYFSNQDLWYELLCAGCSESVPWIQHLTTNLHVFSDAMRLLCHYGLVEGEKLSEEKVESGGYSIHSRVHSWAIHVLNAQ
ncbi:hypothetical protein LTR85_001000 [Meristemomyces frigidus]|nr:hypothetical protein LTR85_001000 [Meristemomyces frigidus]